MLNLFAIFKILYVFPCVNKNLVASEDNFSTDCKIGRFKEFFLQYYEYKLF